MQSEIFEKTTAITSAAVEVFNSETYSIDVANAVLMGVSITNTGAANAQLQIDIKTHPNSAWMTHTAMGATSGLGATNTTNISSTFFRVSIGALNNAIVNANSNGYFAVNLRFVYAIRILSKMASGTSGNTIRVRGNIKKAGDIDYAEQSLYGVAVGTVTGATVPTWFDTSRYAYFSATWFFTGTNTFSNIAANTLPNQPAITSGYLMAMRLYPGDTNYYFLDAINTASAIAGDKTSVLLRSHSINSTDRLVPLVMLADAAYEIGFIFNIPGGSNVDCHISLNG